MASFSHSPRNTSGEEERQADKHHYVQQEKTVDHHELDISTLPKAKGWLVEFIYQFQGFWINAAIIKGIIISQKQLHLLNPAPTVLMASFPKSGCTWLKALLFAITTRAENRDPATHPLLTSNPHDCVPFFEFYAAKNPLNPIPESTSLLATHIPFDSLPESIKCSACPIVYLYRCPKDVLVSLWHFANHGRSLESLPPLSIEEAVDMFCQGQSPYGPSWDHLLGYWEASLKMPQRILFVSYEDMKSEPVEYLKRLASFVGHPFSVEEEKEGIPESIIDLCSFKKLSSLEVNKPQVTKSFVSIVKMTNNHLFRKGEIGDNRNHLTTEMIERLDKVTGEKWKKTGLSF